MSSDRWGHRDGGGGSDSMSWRRSGDGASTSTADLQRTRSSDNRWSGGDRWGGGGRDNNTERWGSNTERWGGGGRWQHSARNSRFQWVDGGEQGPTPKRTGDGDGGSSSYPGSSIGIYPGGGSALRNNAAVASRYTGSRPPDPQLLTSWIKKADSLEKLWQLDSEHGYCFDDIHISTAYWQVHMIVRNRGPGDRGSRREASELLQRLWQRLEPQLDRCDAWGLANIVWACGKVGFAEPDMLEKVLHQLAAAADTAKPQALANAVYAAALLDASGCNVAAKSSMQQPLVALVAALAAKRHAATPQELSNALWGAAKVGLKLPARHVEQLVAALVQQRRATIPQDQANALWAVAKMGQRLPPGQVEDLVASVVERRWDATQQNISNILWAAATLGERLPAALMQQLVSGMVEKRWDAAPQALANAMWALAKLSYPLSEDHMQRLLEALAAKQNVANSYDLANTLWACADMKLCFPELVDQIAAALLQQAAAAAPQALSNAAQALAKLDCGSPKIFSGLAEAMMRVLVREWDENIVPRDISNLCWAVAVADQRQCAPQVLRFCERLATDPQMWRKSIDKVFSQLYQVHLWLCDWQQQGTADDQPRGLAGVLSPAQLQQCREGWEASLVKIGRQAASDYLRQVYACACRLPETLQDCRHEARSDPDGAFSIDINATHAPSGRRLAIEADGPYHFMQPGHRLAGPTRARNRALAARGYVVVSVPWWEWNSLGFSSHEEEERFLAAAVEAAVAAAAAAETSGSGGSGHEEAT